jgi:hypothetical protein
VQPPRTDGTNVRREYARVFPALFLDALRELGYKPMGKTFRLNFGAP